ncbi:MAG: FTR1 family iron permease [Deltaproteobacteria bacterium]|nr:FTR1 family iron permease [Deltaproteobacteria bacterium]
MNDLLTRFIGDPHRPLRLLAALLGSALFLSLVSPSFSSETPRSWDEVASDVRGVLDQALLSYAKGERAEALEGVNDAYFLKFEASGMEMAVSQYLGSRTTYDLEDQFGELRNGIKKGASHSAVKEEATLLGRSLQEVAKELVKLGAPLQGMGYVGATTTANVVSSSSREVMSDLDEAFGILLEHMDQVKALVSAGQHAEAGKRVGDLYFDDFEGRGLETAIGLENPSVVRKIEMKFANLRTLIRKSDPQWHPEWESLRADLFTQRARFQAKRQVSGWSAFLSSALILVREGFEALLIIFALIALLSKMGQGECKRGVYVSSLAAVVASVLTAAALALLVRQFAWHREVLEGATMLVASGMLLYVGMWMLLSAKGNRIQKKLKERVDLSFSSNRLWIIWATAFLAVYREGAESILFYSALLSSTDSSHTTHLIAGMAGGAFALFLLALVMKRAFAVLPVKRFFQVTSVLLASMAFSFAGKGMIELQAAGIVGATHWKWAPTFSLLGIFPTAQSLMLQLLVLAAIAIILIFNNTKVVRRYQSE